MTITDPLDLILAFIALIIAFVVTRAVWCAGRAFFEAMFMDREKGE